jgi:hypothetical protein
MRSWLCGLLALVPACAVDASTQPTDEDYADLATSLGSSAAHDGGELSVMRDAAALARGEPRDGLSRLADGAYDGTVYGLHYHLAITCRSSDAQAVAPCDGTGDAAEVEAAWSGRLDLPQLALSIEHEAHWQLSRMVGDIAHVDGTGRLAYDTRDDAATHHYAYDASYHVVIDDQRAIGGDIRFAIDVAHTGPAARRYTVAAALAFEPDDTALLVLDGARRYRVALATGAVTPLGPPGARD